MIGLGERKERDNPEGRMAAVALLDDACKVYPGTQHAQVKGLFSCAL